MSPTTLTTDLVGHIQRQAQAQHEQVVGWRRHLHRHAELSFKEVDTADFIENELKQIAGFEVTRPTPTSLVATLKGGQPGKVLAIRADIDALPIQDQKNCDYASTRPGVMHACGHDGHTAMLLGTAHLLSSLREQIPGEVRLFFQHAEEQHPGGAQEMVNAGVMEGVDQIISAHLMSTIETGKVVVLDGPALASSDRFVLTVQGKGGHAANPDKCVDPIWIGSQIVANLQAVVARNTSAHDPLIVSITRFLAGGDAFNVIPDQAELAGSVRCYSPAVREQVPVLLERIAKGVAEAHGASIQLNYIKGYQPVVNDPAVAGAMRDVVGQALADVVLHSMDPLPNSEDFGAFTQHAPGAYGLIDARSESKGIRHPHHHPHFDFDEDALEYGVRLFTAAPFLLNRSR